MAEVHINTETNEQPTSIENIIITKSRIFADAVKKWNNKPKADQTWPNFNTHFITAQINYKKKWPDNTSKYYGYKIQANVVEVVLHELENSKKSKTKSVPKPKPNTSSLSNNPINPFLSQMYSNKQMQMIPRIIPRQNSNPSLTLSTQSKYNWTTVVVTKTESNSEVTELKTPRKLKETHKKQKQYIHVLIYTRRMQTHHLMLKIQ